MCKIYLNEMWKDISGYEGLYQVSNYGRVKSLARVRWNGRTNCVFKEKVLKTWVSKQGYECIALWNKSKQNFYVHRLVAEAFIPNKDNLPEVNHINENKTDNKVTNLEWCTSKYNKEYSCIFGKGGRAQKGIPKSQNHRENISKGLTNRPDLSKQISQIDLEGNVVKIWPSANEVYRSLGYQPSSIRRCCRKQQKTAYNYIWKETKEVC